MTGFSDIDAGGAEFQLSLQDDLTRELQQTLSDVGADVARAAKQINADLSLISQGIASTGKEIAAIGAGVTAVGAASVLSFGRAVRVAGDFAETVNMFEAVFKGQSKEIREWGREYGKVVGRSESQLLSFLAQSQDTFVPLGFDRREAAELSKTVSKLAIDLGSFKNIDDQDSLRRLLGGLVGNTENLKLFGVQATQAAIKAKALSLGFDPRNLTSYQKALAILEITIDGTKDAQGDAARTAGGFVNSVKALGAEITRFAISIGEPIKAAVTGFIRGFTFLLSKLNDLLEAFPILSQVAAGISVAMTTIGAAVTAAGAAIAAFGTSFIGLVLLKKLGVNITLIVQKIISLKAALASLAFRSAFTGLGIAVRAALAGIIAAVAGFTKVIIAFAARFAVALINPWTGLAIAITAAISLAERYYKKQQEFEARRGLGLDRERERIVAQSFRDAGQAVPADLSKTLDVNNAQVVNTQEGALTKESQDLADEITGFKTALEEFKDRIKSAKELQDRGTITEAQFASFSARELEKFKQSDPVTQARESLREQLMTPLERFQQSISQAEKVFSEEPAMLARARESAMAQFKANDAATQLAEQLLTPLERFQKAIAKAKEVFADSPKNLARAIAAAKEQFEDADPATQLRRSLRTPIEIYRDGLEELKEIIANAVPEIRDDLLARGKKQLDDRFNKTDPDQVKTKSIRESLLNTGEKIAKSFLEAVDLVKKGLLTDAELREFRKKLVEDAIGKAPEGQLSRSLQTTNASIASQLGAFAPAMNRDDQLIEFNKKKIKLQGQIRDGINKLNKIRGVLGR